MIHSFLPLALMCPHSHNTWLSTENPWNSHPLWFFNKSFPGPLKDSWLVEKALTLWLVCAKAAVSKMGHRPFSDGYILYFFAITCYAYFIQPILCGLKRSLELSRCIQVSFSASLLWYLLIWPKAAFNHSLKMRVPYRFYFARLSSHERTTSVNTTENNLFGVSYIWFRKLKWSCFVSYCYCIVSFHMIPAVNKNFS